MMDPNLGLAARNNLLYIADHWTDLRARLRPGGGNALTGMPSGTSEGHCPIDVGISDLLWEIENEARTLGHVLMDETDDWAPRTSRMPALLVDVAARYGHWTAGDERTALAFMDWAEEYAGKVSRALFRPAPRSYVGPCQGDGGDGAGCGGELYLRDGEVAGVCRECGRPFTYAEQRKFVERELQVRALTLAEIAVSLAYMGKPRSLRTLQEWAHDELLKPTVVIEGEASLYLFRDALELAETRRRGRPRDARVAA